VGQSLYKKKPPQGNNKKISNPAYHGYTKLTTLLLHDTTSKVITGPSPTIVSGDFA
jgi:hypothetical protein